MKCVKRLTAAQQRLVEEICLLWSASCGLISKPIPVFLALAMRTCIKRAVSGSAMQH